MARFFGKVGYGQSVEKEDAPGVWVDEIVKRDYYGDVLRDITKLEQPQTLNKNIVVNNSISIVADKYAIEHFSKIKYVEWAGEKWTVTNVESKPPRLILTIGSVYHGPTI